MGVGTLEAVVTETWLTVGVADESGVLIDTDAVDVARSDCCDAPEVAIVVVEGVKERLGVDDGT